MKLGRDTLGRGEGPSDPHGPSAAGAHGDVDAKDAGQQRHPGHPGRSCITQLSLEQGCGGRELDEPARDKQRELLGLGRSFVSARHRQPLVLGGLTREIESIADSKVPGLANIPVLGWLFRGRKRRKEKVSLLMVIVPHVIESPDDARRIHERRMEERVEFLQRYTAFKRRGLTTHVNYRKKAGLLSAVNAAAGRQEDDARFAQRAASQLEQAQVRTTIDPAEPAVEGATPALKP